MKSLVTVQNLYRRGAVFRDKETEKLEVKGIEDGAITLGGEVFDMAIADTLSRFTLLYDVPFSYLTPDDKMLPEESIRFFRLDSLWMKRLLDGALSIGQNTKYDYDHDSWLIDSIFNCAIKNNMQVRRNLAEGKKSEEFDENYRKISEKIGDDTVYSGFLLRSSLVRHFEGLEVIGYDNPTGDGEPLLIARFDNLSKDVCLCLFCGELRKLVMKQPPEGIHLGFLPEGKKTLRSRENGILYPEATGSIPIWEEGDGEDRKNGVIRYHKVAEKMKSTLMKLSKLQEDKRPVDSSDMALQLIQNALTGEFILAPDQ